MSILQGKQGELAPGKKWQFRLGFSVLILLASVWALPAAAQRTLYIDYQNGSDSNTGTSQSSAWKTVPGMANSGVSGYSCQAGDRFILKGGVTWDYHIWPFSFPCSGSSTTSSFGCTGSGCTYIGVDKSWHVGSSWKRPILSGGDWSNPGTNTVCNYDTANGGNLMLLAGIHHLIIDNLEFAGICSSTGHNSSGNYSVYLQTQNNPASQYVTAINCYFHRGVFPASAAPTHGDFYGVGGIGAFGRATFNVIDFSDSGPTTTYTSGGQGFYTGRGIAAPYVDHNVFYNLPEALDTSLNSVHDNYFYNASAKSAEGDVHPHISNDSPCSDGRQVTWYNNVIDTVYWGQGWQPQTGPCSYFSFNNVWSNTGVGRLLNWGPSSSTFHLFNNTMECGQDSSASGVCGHFNYSLFTVQNDHFVTSASPIDCGQGYPACLGFVTSTSTLTSAVFTSIPNMSADILIQSKAAANAQGFTYSSPYQFSPGSSSSATVSKGVNLSALCVTIIDASAQAACRQDTTYAVSYDKTNHAVVASTRAVNNRPSTGSWDVGAYQFSGTSSGTQVNPPTGLQASVQ